VRDDRFELFWSVFCHLFFVKGKDEVGFLFQMLV